MNKLARTLLLLPVLGWAQPILEMQKLAAPRLLEFSSDGSRLWYKLGADWFEIATAPNSTPKRTSHTAPPQKAAPMTAIRKSDDEKSPDGKHVAYLGAERPYGPALVFAASGEPGTAAKPISRMPVSFFHWAADSDSLWVIGADSVDEPVGRLHLDGRFEAVTHAPAMRLMGGLAAANDVLAWTQSDEKHPGAIWIRERSGAVRMLLDPNPQAAKWNPGTQEVVRWKNAHGEELAGILAKPSKGDHFPLVVDPYSCWRNRYLSVPVMGNYEFVREGYAVFYPDHRGITGFPEDWFGEAYMGAAKTRDPVDVLTEDVMTGVNELIHRGVADPDRLFLYSTSNGASMIGELLGETRAFRAAVALGGVYDWLGYYQVRHPLGDETIPGFLGGRTPIDSLDLYKRISPFYQADRIKTPLLLAVGDKDNPRYDDNQRFYDALVKAGSPVKLVVYPGEGHSLSTPELGVKHIRAALEFFRSAPPAK